MADATNTCGTRHKVVRRPPQFLIDISIVGVNFSCLLMAPFENTTQRYNKKKSNPRKRHFYFVLCSICTTVGFAEGISIRKNPNRFGYFLTYAYLCNMNTYKLIAVDLDGTLVRSDQRISQRTIDALVQVQRMGVKVAVASGRPTFGTAHVADTLRLEEFGGYVMSYNGGEIYNWRTKSRLHAQTLDKELIPYIYMYAKEHGLPAMTYIGKEVVSEVADDEYIRHSVMRNRMTLRQVDDFVGTAQEAGVVKCVIVGDPTLLPAMETELQERLKGKAGVFRSEPFFLEIVPKGIDKAKGLSILLNKIGVKREELIAFGDGYNDISMIEFAGMGVAMENAAEVIKNAADFVTRSNNDDGIVYALEKFIPRLLDKPY